MTKPKGVLVVTGASGRIGVRLAEKLGKDYDIVGFDIVPPPEGTKNIDYVHVDLTSDEGVEKGFEYVKAKYGLHIVSVVHLAAYYSFEGKRPELYDKITVQGTERILKNLKNFRVEQFIFSSTLLIYEPCRPDQKINEKSKVLPKWDYPKSKVKTEELIHKMHGNVPVVILQIAGCYDDDCYSIPISNQIQRIYEKQPIARLFPGNLTHGASFLHFDDLVDSIRLSIEKRKHLPNEVTMIIGEDKTMSYDELQREIFKLLFGKEMKTIRIPKWFAKAGAWSQNHIPFLPKTFVKPWMIDLADDNFTVDISKAEKLLGWKPKHYVKNTLPKMISLLNKDPLGWYKKNELVAPKWLIKNFEKKCSSCK